MDEIEFEEARRALDAGDLDRAVSLFEAVIARRPQSGPAWFNLGLAHKGRRDWPASARCYRRAAELDDRNEEAFWNLGIAATAQADWSTARWAWRGLGIDPGPGNGPPELDLGPSPIRLNPDGNGEVTWGRRVDPCRAILVNVPLPESGHRWGDIVLHDVVPSGERQAWGRSWSVFDELIRMEPGPLPTLESQVTAPTEQDSRALQAAAAEAGHVAEDWTATLRFLCRRCSLSSPHEHAERGGVMPTWLPTRRFGFAGPTDALVAILAAWSRASPGRAYTALRESEPS
jgi:hypothetical protein